MSFPGDFCHVGAEFKERDYHGCQMRDMGHHMGIRQMLQKNLVWPCVLTWFTYIDYNACLFPPYFCHLTLSGCLSGPFPSWPVMTSWPKSGGPCVRVNTPVPNACSQHAARMWHMAAVSGTPYPQLWAERPREQLTRVWSSGVLMSAVSGENSGAWKPKANVASWEEASLADRGLNTCVRSFRTAPEGVRGFG